MTGDRVAEIRRVREFIRQWAMKRDGANEIYGVHIDINGDMANLYASDLACLLADNARLRAQLDAIRELADNAQPLQGLETTYAGNVTVEQLRAALNQGGETNGE